MEHRGRQDCTRPDAAADAELLLLVRVITEMQAVGVLAWLDALVLHVLDARLCGVL